MNLTYPVDALVSYHYYQREDLMAGIVAPRHLRLIGDSGAFSAYTQGKQVKLADYAAWCRHWADHLAWVAALDVIGDPAATFRNWAAFRDRYGINAVPTLHAGADPKLLDAYATQGVDYVGLGGLVGIAARAFPWIVRVMRYARDRHPKMRFHAWGVTNRKILDSVPFYSADSSGIMGQAYRFGRLRVFDPVTRRDILIHLNGRDAFQHAALLKRVYGITPKQVATSGPENRALLIQMAAASTQQYAAWLQARHKVTPPKWGLNDQPPPASATRPHVHLAGRGRPADDLSHITPGPRVHMVSTFAGDYTVLTPEGPRIHVDAAQGGNNNAALRPGPRVHLVDSNPNYLKGLQP